MAVLAVALGIVFLAGPLLLGYLLFGEVRRGLVRLTPLLALSGLQALLATWCLGVLAASFALEPWVMEQRDAALVETVAVGVRSAAVVALLWLPGGIAVAVLLVRALHRGDVDRLQLPLVALVLYGAALVWSSARLMAGA